MPTFHDIADGTDVADEDRMPVSASPAPSVYEWVQLIRAEYQEFPGLSLTRPQVRRLWNLEPNVCDAVVQELTKSGFLRRTRTGTYVLADDNR